MKVNLLLRVINVIIVFLTANLLIFDIPGGIEAIIILLFIIINIKPLYHGRSNLQSKRLQVCRDGIELIYSFLLATTLSVIYILAGPSLTIGQYISDGLIVFFVCAIVFWNGIIRIYITSYQLGLKWRVIGIICGWIIFINIIVLLKIIRVANAEVEFENDKILLNNQRHDQQICKTKYPLLLVHGVFFRDYKYFNYWGRIPGQLETNGAKIFYGNHESASSVEDSGAELAARIKTIIDQTGCEKVNIIAHSKGGLDCRYAIDKYQLGDCVASLTTINTPHQGCEFAESLISKCSENVKQTIANKYNSALRKVGDKNPDFLVAIESLLASNCKRLSSEINDHPNVYYQSVGSKLNVAISGRFPLNITHPIVNHFDGPNDGLVAVDCMWLGEHYKLVTTTGIRGVSHGDMIDLNRENIAGFDVREFYVKLVSDLRTKGL